MVFEAWLRVKANKGAAGVDEVSIMQFEEKLKDNLYKVWNRMSSGTYFPPPVRRVMIPKADGGERPLGGQAHSRRHGRMVHSPQDLPQSRRDCAKGEPDGPRVDRLLWEVSQIGPVRCISLPESTASEMGTTEIQKARTSTSGLAMASAYCPQAAHAVCSLAIRRVAVGG